MTSSAITLTPINGEPRVHDLHLAERLGFDRPVKIRELIKRNEEKLKKFNILPTVGKIHEGAGRPTVEYYLDQKQAIFICMKSETDRAFDVQVEIVRVFDAYLNGNLQPIALPNFEDPIAAAEAWIAERKARNLIQRELDASQPKIAFHDQVVSSEALMDFPSMFSLLQRRTGQRFNRRTFLEFCRRNGIACQPNPHSGITTGRFVPRKDYTETWFVSEMHTNGVTEWMVRPLAVAAIVSLIEMERHHLACPRTALKRLDDDQEAA